MAVNVPFGIRTGLQLLTWGNRRNPHMVGLFPFRWRLVCQRTAYDLWVQVGPIAVRIVR